MLDTTPQMRWFRFQTEALGLRGTTAIVLFAGCANVLGATILTLASWATIQRSGVLGIATYLSSILYGIAGVVVAWVFLAALFHVVSGLYDADGSFRVTLVRTGLGFIPIACSGLINAGAILIKSSGVTFPADPDRLGPFVQQLTTGPLFTATTILGIGFALWSGWIWATGLRTARDISSRAAEKTVALPVAVWIVWQVHSVL